jgi:hypothetical protein
MEFTTDPPQGGSVVATQAKQKSTNTPDIVYREEIEVFQRVLEHKENLRAPCLSMESVDLKEGLYVRRLNHASPAV